MADLKNDGGSAFPRVCGDRIHDLDNGMSLRDWFAGQALSAMNLQEYSEEGCFPDGVVADCFKLADAMLAERTKDPA